MNGLHDLGGMHGFGPIAAEPQESEPVFHHDWEPLVLSVALSTLRLRRWSLDEFRHTIENQPPLSYLRRTYYEKWLAALEELVVSHGLVTPDELTTRVAAHTATSAVEATWTPVFDTPDTKPAFTPGHRVRVANRHPRGHTRQPRYVRGRVGTVLRHVGGEPLPEQAARGVCETEHLYVVRFEAAELWGADAGQYAVYLELWESYLELVGP